MHILLHNIDSELDGMCFIPLVVAWVWPESQCHIFLSYRERDPGRLPTDIARQVQHWSNASIFLSNLYLNISGCGPLWRANLLMNDSAC